jgi:hypothetical protein
MIQFIFLYLAIISFGVMLTIIVRRGRMSHFITSDIPVKLDHMLMRYSERMVRRLKVIVLRADNYLTERLKRWGAQLKPTTPKIDFKDIEHASELMPKE